MDRDYRVFISHAGPDKLSLALPLYDRLRQRNINAFLDREELRAGDNGPIVMEHAMKNAPVGVFVLSPEFAARAWTMRELMCFQQREQDAIMNGWPIPKLIPVFYRLNVRECRDPSIFYRKNERGESYFFQDKFFDRVLQGRITMQQVFEAVKLLSLRTGVENNANATNDDTQVMERERASLLDRIVEAVIEAVHKVENSSNEDGAIGYWRQMQSSSRVAGASQASQAPQGDEFVPHFEIWQNPRYVSLAMDSDHADPANPSLIPSEGKAKRYILDGAADHAVVAIQGMPGVGKTCTMRALCHDRDIRDRFVDGVYVLSLGANASVQTFIGELCRAIRCSGGHDKERDILKLGTEEAAVSGATDWFKNRSCLFLMDDVWSTSSLGRKSLEWLSRVMMTGNGSVMVISTREKDLLMHKTVTQRVRLYAHEPRGAVSRRILLQSASSEPGINLLHATNQVVNALLDSCAGLPVALAVTGRSVGRLALDMQDDLDRAFQGYYNFQSDIEEPVIERDIDEYMSLSRALSTSLSILRQNMSTDPSVHLSYSYEEMYRSLCILHKQQWAPLTILCRLWNLSSGKDASFVLERFSDVGLVDVQYKRFGDVDVKGLRLHDLVHDFVMKEAISFEDEEIWHNRLLQSYKLQEEENVGAAESCRPWWTAKVTIDNYLQRNLFRHLLGSGKSPEAIVLAGRPLWITRQLHTSGVVQIERDFLRLEEYLLTHREKVYPFDDTLVEDLMLLLNAIRLSVIAILNNPREVCFQLSARLILAKKSSMFIKRVVDYAEAHSVKPFLRPMTACLHTAETMIGRVIPCSMVRSLTIVEEDDSVFVGTEDGRILIYDFESAELRMEWKAHALTVSQIAVTRNKRYLVSSSNDKTIRVFDLTKECAEVSVFCFTEHIWCFRLIPNTNTACSARLIAASREFISFWNLETGECMNRFLGFPESKRWVTSLAVSPDGKRIAAGSFGGEVKIWTEKKEQIPEQGWRDWWLLRAFRNWYQYTLTWWPADTRALTRSESNHDNSNTQGSEGGISLAALNAIVTELCFSQSGEKLISATYESIRVWNTETRLPTAIFEGCSSTKFLSTVGDCQEEKILSTGSEGKVKVYTLDGTLLHSAQFADKGADIQFAKVSHDGQKVVWSEGNNIRVVGMGDLLQENSSYHAKHEGEVLSMCMTPNGARAVTGGVDHNVMIWDTESGSLVGSVLEAHPHVVRSVIVTPDGQKILSFSNPFVVVWDLQSQQQIARFDAHENSVMTLQVTLDGKFAITGSRDKTVRIWDLEECTGKHVVLNDHRSTVRFIYLEQNGKQFVSLSETEGVLWDIEPPQPVKMFEHEEICFVPLEQVDTLFDVTLIRTPYQLGIQFQTGDAVLERDAHWKCLQMKGRSGETILATMDAKVSAFCFSPITKTLCLGLGSGHVSMLKVEIEE